MEGAANTRMEDYVNPRVANAVATNTTLATTVAANLPKRVLKLPKPPGHPDGPGSVDIEVIQMSNQIDYPFVNR